MQNFFSDPAKLMKLMNEQVAEFMRKRDFISVFYGILNYKNHNFVYCNCGHNPGLHISTKNIKLIEGGGPSLNLLKDAEFKTFVLNLEISDQILLYTDGVVEVFSKDKKQFGLERLIEVFNLNSDKSPNEIIEKIISSTKEFSLSNLYNDDFTLLVVKRDN